MLRTLFRLALTGLLLSGVASLAVVISTAGSIAALDLLYFPSRASMQAHADALAQHILHRVTEPPLPVLPHTATPDTSWPRNPPSGPSPGLPPYLATADLPQRYPVIWSQQRGWLSDTAPALRERFAPFFAGMAAHEGWDQPTLTQVTMDPASDRDPMVFAGSWVLSDGDLFFRGALTPLDVFHDSYLDLWTEEYLRTSTGSLLRQWMWQPAELRYLPADSLQPGRVLLASEPGDLAGMIGDRGDDPPPPGFEALARLLAGPLTPEPGWRDDAVTVTAPLYPLQARIEMRSPFLVNSLLIGILRASAWWALAVFVIAIALLMHLWVRNGRTR